MDDIDLLLLEIELAIKHGSHNQATHGRKGPRGMTYLNEYRAARARGESIEDARYYAKEARQIYDAEQYEARNKARKQAFKDRAAHLRKLVADEKLTDYQARVALLRAENLDARARGERVPHKQIRVSDDITRPSVPVARDARLLRKELAGKSAEESARIMQEHLASRITPGVIDYRPTKSVESIADNWARAEVAALQSMIDRRSLNTDPIGLASKQSSRADYKDGTIRMQSKNDQLQLAMKLARPEQFASDDIIKYVGDPSELGFRGTFAHEFGHHLNEQPQVKAAAVAFLKRRTANDSKYPTTLVRLRPNEGYNKTETCKPDRFIHPYVGKWDNLSTGQTEIVSMGIQFMRLNPAEFARRDPDHFDFIYKILRGDI